MSHQRDHSEPPAIPAPGDAADRGPATWPPDDADRAGSAPDEEAGGAAQQPPNMAPPVAREIQQIGRDPTAPGDA